MQIPYEPEIIGLKINIHLFFELASYFIGFRYYLYLRKKVNDEIPSINRLWIILGAIIGGYLGSRIVAWSEQPYFEITLNAFWNITQSKSIMGGLFGGLIGVEVMKLIIKEKSSSGDLFTFPIIIGIMIGRIGCFLKGVKEFTYGIETTIFLGMNLGDGLLRHPIMLYEIIFLLSLSLMLIIIRKKLSSGELFKLFMILYFTFRFVIEFIKPNTFFILGLSSIQWLCLICLLYYSIFIINFIQNACKRLYIL